MMLLLLLLLLLLALCPPSCDTAPSGAGADAGALLQRGLALQDQGRAAEALPMYDAALALLPELTAAVIAPKAAALEELGRLGDAQAAAAMVDAADVWQLDVAFALGWQRRGRVEEAIAAYRRAAAAAPAVRQVQVNLGLALRKQGRLEEAIESLRHALELSEGEAAADVQFHLGVSLKRLARASEAAGAFRSCLKLAPHHAEANHLLAALDASARSAVPAKASESYVRGVFDAAAAEYDQHLEGMCVSQLRLSHSFPETKLMSLLRAQGSSTTEGPSCCAVRSLQCWMVAQAPGIAGASCWTLAAAPGCVAAGCDRWRPG